MTYCHKGALAIQRGIDGHKRAQRFQALTQPAICPQQNPASCDASNPKDGHNSLRRNWGEGTSFFRSSGGAQNWSFPEPHSHWEGSEKTCGMFHACSTSLDILQKHYMTGSLPIGAQAHKDTDNGSELHLNGQRKVLSFPALAG